jgi:hypothetical protein
MTVDQTQFPRELEDSFDSCSYIEEYIADEYFLHKICHTLQKIIQITPKKKPMDQTQFPRELEGSFDSCSYIKCQWTLTVIS